MRRRAEVLGKVLEIVRRANKAAPATGGSATHDLPGTPGTDEWGDISVEAATFMGATLSATVEAKVLPTAYALHQNYPNPFNPSTSLAIDFPTASPYTLTIYNIAGQVVKTYAGHADAGTYTITWNGTDNRGSKVASGVYFYAVEADGFNAIRKMVLMR